MSSHGQEVCACQTPPHLEPGLHERYKNELHRHMSCLKEVIAVHDMLWTVDGVDSVVLHSLFHRAATYSQAAVCPAAQSSKVQSRQSTFVPGAAAGLTPTLQRRRTRASLRACNWDPLPSAPLVLLDGPYAAPAMRWEVRQQRCPVTAWRRCSRQSTAPAAGTMCTVLAWPCMHEARQAPGASAAPTMCTPPACPGIVRRANGPMCLQLGP